MKRKIIGACAVIGMMLLVGCTTNAKNGQGRRMGPSMGGQARPMQGPDRNGIGGKVESIEGFTITISNPQGKGIIIADDATKFTKNGNPATLVAVVKGVFVEAKGKKQADGAWLASEIAISDQPPQGGPQGGPQGSPPAASNPSGK